MAINTLGVGDDNQKLYIFKYIYNINVSIDDFIFSLILFKYKLTIN